MPFTPSNSGQRSPPTYYRGCWHVVSRGFFPWYRPFSSQGKAVYTPKSVLLHAALLRQSLRSIAENSSLLPPVGVWAVLNPSVADRPLRPATDRRLGRLLPHQPANRPQAHPKATLRKGPLLSPLYRKEPMRACRRFLAGIPHFGPGHPCLTHPSATPSRSEKQEDVRLACVRHAASVYPEPGSNSPSVFMSPPARADGHILGT